MIELVNDDEVAKRVGHKKYSIEQLIDKMQQWVKENGRIPIAVDFSGNPRYPSQDTYQKEFGSWNNALADAGLVIREKYSKRPTRDKLIEILQQWVKENGRIPVEQEFRNNPKYPSYGTYYNEFGSWNNALAHAELVIRQKNKIYSREQLIEIMQKWVKNKDRIPTRNEFVNNPDYPSFQTYVIEFGSWADALITAGFEPNDTTTMSRKAEIQTLQEFKTEGAIDLS